MRKYAGLALGLAFVGCGVLVAQTPVIMGDHSTPLRTVAGAGNVGISNAVLRDQPEVRVLRVVVEPGGIRLVHAHDDVKFHMFIPITGPMQLDLDGAEAVTVTPWQPYVMKAGTKHGFHNSGSSPVEVMEVFVR